MSDPSAIAGRLAGRKIAARGDGSTFMNTLKVKKLSAAAVLPAYAHPGDAGLDLINHGQRRFEVEPGMKITQLVVASCLTIAVEEAVDLGESARGQGGFGSTGA